MARQLLIYETAVPLAAQRHADACVEAVEGYGFSAGINALPLTTVEFARASPEYPIVFVEEGGLVLPRVVLGLRNGENLFLQPDARWDGDYVPAYLRRYPFVFSSSDDGQTLTLCIDETYPGFNREARGMALFETDGQPTAYVGQVLGFVKEYQVQFNRTSDFGRRLAELGLLEPMKATVKLPGGDQIELAGFTAVSRERLHALPGDALQLLARHDELEPVYLHLASMRNFDRLKERLDRIVSSSSPAQAAPAVDASPAPAKAPRRQKPSEGQTANSSARSTPKAGAGRASPARANPVSEAPKAKRPAKAATKSRAAPKRVRKPAGS